MMFSIALFLHITGALGLFAGIAIEMIALAALRRATSAAQLREWVRPIGVLRRIMMPSMILLVVTGGYLAMSSHEHAAWVVVGMIGVVAMAVLGAVVIRRRVAAIAQAVPAHEGALSPALRDRLQDPVLYVAAWLRTALGLGIVFDMSVKPETPVALAALVVSLVLGAVLAARSVGRRVTVPT